MTIIIGDRLGETYSSNDILEMDEQERDWAIEGMVALMMQNSRFEGSTRKGLMPSLNERTYTPRAPPKIPDHPKPTHFKIEPYKRSDIGDTSFDFNLGGLVGVTDTVLTEVSEEDLRQMQHWELEPGQPFQFKHDPEGNRIYYFVSNEKVRFTNDLEVEVHAKSTSGRLGCHTRLAGTTKEGRLVTILQPLAFNLIARSGQTSFSQGVVRYKDTSYATLEEIRERGLLNFEGEGQEDFLTPRGPVIRFDTSRAYAAKRTDRPIDMSVREKLNPVHWWEEIEGNSEIVLDAKRLYLLGSQGVMTLNGACGVISKEQETFNGLGGFGCLAGVVQPGWRGGITMEPYYPNRTRIRTGDVAGHILVDMVEGKIPEKAGDESKVVYTGDYQGQKAPKLPKMFKG